MKHKLDCSSSSSSESSSSSDSESHRRRSKSKKHSKHSKKKSRKDKKSEIARKSLISAEKKTTSNQAHEYNSLPECSSTDEEEVELYRRSNKTAVASASKSPNSSKTSVKLQESPIRESSIADMEKFVHNQLKDNKQQNEPSIQYESLVHYFIKQAANSSDITSMPTTSTSDANQQSIPTTLISNKNSENDTPKDFRKKGNCIRNEFIFPNKILMICQRKGCQFGVLHECRQLFSDIVSNAHQLRDGSGDIIDKVEVGKIARCKYCSFVVIHKLCQEKPDETKNGMYTSISSQTRVCADCKWRMIYTCNNDQNRNQCHWTKDNPTECTCGCIEVHHDCNLQLRKKT